MDTQRVGIVGAGLVGALEACLLAKRGFQVTLFERRHDGRNEVSYFGRSINLAISHRGIKALERLGMEHLVHDHAIPMKARLIHDRDGRRKAIPYDPDGRCINSIERASLNNVLLNKAEREFGVKILFNHKLVDLDIEHGRLYFRKTKKQSDSFETSLVTYDFDLVLGCDGSRSAVRSLLAQRSQIEVSQSYIDHGYMELRIDPGEGDNKFKMEQNFLHIWPRKDYMMIALPNKDATFTCTLFLSMDSFKTLQEPKVAEQFFRENFADSIELIGLSRICETLKSNRASSLVSVRCKPYNIGGKFALLGDAAHAMVPFYGQGMNCGFEDCLVLDELIDLHSTSSIITDWNAILEAYSAARCPNGLAMADLAMYNYIEMRSLVNTWSFKMRKYFDGLMYSVCPSKWIPLYTMVTFTRLPIDECMRRRERQDRIVGRLKTMASVCLGGSLLAMSLLSSIKRTKLHA